MCLFSIKGSMHWNKTRSLWIFSPKPTHVLLFKQGRLFCHLMREKTSNYFSNFLFLTNWEQGTLNTVKEQCIRENHSAQCVFYLWYLNDKTNWAGYPAPNVSIRIKWLMRCPTLMVEQMNIYIHGKFVLVVQVKHSYFPMPHFSCL